MRAKITDNKETKDYTAYVNPFIGTGGHGHTFPGAVVPIVCGPTVGISRKSP